MSKSNQSSLDIADHLSRGEYDWCPEAETRLREQHDRIKELEANPVKELTDEEILKLAADKFHYSEYKLVIDFAKEILRKAQEK